MGKYDDKYTVYLFYLDNELYAYCTNKEYRDSFILERDMKQFKYRKVKMKDYDYYQFTREFGLKGLSNIPLNIDMERYVMVTGTEMECSLAGDRCDQIDTEIQTAAFNILHSEYLDDKDKEIIKNLSKTYDMVRENETELFASSRINQFKVYMELFGHLYDEKG